MPMIGNRHFTDLQYEEHKARAISYLKTPEGKKNHSKAMVLYYKRKRLELIDLFGNKCARCGFTDIRALQLDHINGGGGRESRSIGSTAMYLRYAKDPELARLTLQVLCANCNWIKRYERDENVRGRYKMEVSNTLN